MAALDPAILNKMLLARVRDMAARQHDPDPYLLSKVQRCLGLFPVPPRTDLAKQSFDQLAGEGYKVLKLTYNSRPSFPVPANVYLPAEGNPDKWIIFAADTWEEGKGSAAAQAFGISMALQGFGVLCTEPPGRWFDKVETERAGQGSAWEPTLRMAQPALGQYVWDLVRGADLAVEMGAAKIAFAGSGIGGEAALFAHVMDERSVAVLLANCAGSLELTPRIPESLCQLPGLAELGDVSDWIGARRPAPALLLVADGDTLHISNAVLKTSDKLNAMFQARGSGAKARFSRILGQPDFTRRMREVAIAFFQEHLAGGPTTDYVVEPRPLTDGIARPYPAGTVNPQLTRVWPDRPDTPVMAYSDAATSLATLESLSGKALDEPYPEVSVELITWGKYGKLPAPVPAESFKIVDANPNTQAMGVPLRELDYNLLSAVGLSGPEFMAQVLHLWLPGEPEGFESVAAGPDGLGAMFASVKTLVKGSEPKLTPSLLEAEGPFSSLVATEFKKLRSGVNVQVTDTFASARDAAAGTMGTALVPGARYRKG